MALPAHLRHLDRMLDALVDVALAEIEAGEAGDVDQRNDPPKRTHASQPKQRVARAFT
jgi:hypothetical protein